MLRENNVNNVIEINNKIYRVEPLFVADNNKIK